MSGELNRRDLIFTAAAAALPLKPGTERTPGGLRAVGDFG